jgi:zeaxanthin glucosyltransferase
MLVDPAGGLNMASILIFVNPNVGSAIASLQLANDLQARGHSVRYMGLADSAATVTANGFEFIPVFADHFPRGLQQEFSRFDTLPFGLDYLRTMEALARRFRRFFDDLLAQGGQSFLALLRQLNPDLMIFASGAAHMEWLALLAGSIGIRGIYWNDMLTPWEGSGIPPCSSRLIPTATFGSRWRIFLAWKMFNLQSALHELLQNLLARASWRRFTIALARHYGYLAAVHRSAFQSDRLVLLPELISIPAPLEFPGPAIPGRYHVEASIYLQRDEPPFPWDALAPDQPILYCALGSVITFSASATALVRAVIAAAPVRPTWKWVLAIGDQIDLNGFGPLPNNVLLAQHAPQLALLQRARIMITHGGTNTIKECLYFGVPMIVFPLMAATLTDWPGNTARVVYHGLGVEGRSNRLDGDYLSTLVDAVDNSAYIRSQIAIMQRKFRALEAEKPSLALIETILRQDQRG